MVPNKEGIVLRDSAGSSSDTRYALLLRLPAQVHGRYPDSTKNSPDHRKTRAMTSARQDAEDRPSGTTRVLDTYDNMDDTDNDKQRLDHVNPFDNMYAYPSGIPVVHDDVPQQMLSCC